MTFIDTAALYGLFRVADDIVDNDCLRKRAEEKEDARVFIAGCRARGRALDAFEASFWEGWRRYREAWGRKGGRGKGQGQGKALKEDELTTAQPLTDLVYSLHPVLPAALETAMRYDFPEQYFHRFFRSMRMDTTPLTMLTEEEVRALTPSASTSNGRGGASTPRKGKAKAKAKENGRRSYSRSRNGKSPSSRSRSRGKKAKQGSNGTAEAENGAPEEMPATPVYCYLGNVCRTRKDMLEYIDGSAAVIGEFMLPLLFSQGTREGEEKGGRDQEKDMREREKKAYGAARALGNAFQLTNFIRDIGEVS